LLRNETENKLSLQELASVVGRPEALSLATIVKKQVAELAFPAKSSEP
jgi:hypothetical protein